MLLKGKTAILYGAAGHIGRSVAEAFARDGARLVLVGRNRAPLETLANALRSHASDVEFASVDATDAAAVRDHLDEVISKVGQLDISFNMISLQDVQGRELVEMSLDDYMWPIEIAARTQFITATAAARHMVKNGRGVIMAITATPSRLALPLVGGFGTACGVVEGMMRTLAAEVGPKGVRVCWLRSAGSPESFGPQSATDVDGEAAGLTDDGYLETIRQATLLKRFPRLAEVGAAATLLASDRASTMTGAALNVTCGQIVD
jgi:3-oxoacyl-[acyl-carrier protein] reductase